MIFADTGALYGLFIRADGKSREAREWYQQNTEPLLTTDHVVSELLTLLRARGHARGALSAGEDLFGETVASIEWVTRADIAQSWAVFQRFSDKDWSFTDCVSYAILERTGINKAFTFDAHFRQFGFIEVVP